MGSIGFELIKELAVLTQGRAPVLSEQAQVNAGALPRPPSAVDAGVALNGAIVALVLARLRSDASTQLTTVEVATVDDTATYSVTIGGVEFTYAAQAGDLAADIIAGLQALIDASPNYTAVIAGSELLIRGVAATKYTVAVAATGTGALSATHDASSIKVRFWGLPTGSTTWHAFPLDPGALTNNWVERLQVAGFERLFVEVTATDGTVTPLVGPCGLEA